MNAPTGLFDSNTQFHPELLSRRGEFVAWGLSAVLVAAWALLGLLGLPVFIGLPFLAIFMLLASSGISLGNWMDRRTSLCMDADGVHFENGLRNTRLKWGEIQEVQVLPSGWGDKVRVRGLQAQFTFRTLGEVKLQDEVKGRMGFVEGQQILQHILEQSSLEPAEQSGAGYYYTRK